MNDTAEEFQEKLHFLVIQAREQYKSDCLDATLSPDEIIVRLRDNLIAINQYINMWLNQSFRKG